MLKFLEQLKVRRKGLGFRQEDMASRVGMSRQQYQRLERQGNPRLDTLELMVKGLQGELMLVPQEKVGLVRALLASDTEGALRAVMSSTKQPSEKTGLLSDDPWGDSLDDLN
ncbi:MAG: helix-turn-helix transcriptional regulator [Gammaproteobacteria bacterium]|nr:helix-turn-helix transcriptional regulator [Gammaproteobacteria bacterium]MBQ0774487.1 helix-turn-helix transcriptional regulator [Gammaproteobacteria bacterium]